MRHLQDRVCVITGGAGSIGLASARRFVAEGAKVVLVDRDAALLAVAADQLPAARTAIVVADVSRTEDTIAYLDVALSRFGAIDVLFSNAGNPGMICPVDEYPDDVFDAVMAVHVRGAFNACKHGLPRMRAGGSIIITSSVAGMRGDPGVVAYITAKHAQIGLMRSVAKEAAARRIRVNTLHPGPIDNGFQRGIERDLTAVLNTDAGRFFDERIPLGRHAIPDEVASAALWLASDQSSFTTASTLMVDGGMHV
jgi:NAD(P)-dependent dehydrogenase (short-subunit alcohol dehydrogenase family)